MEEKQTTWRERARSDPAAPSYSGNELNRKTAKRITTSEGEKEKKKMKKDTVKKGLLSTKRNRKTKGKREAHFFQIKKKGEGREKGNGRETSTRKRGTNKRLGLARAVTSGGTILFCKRINRKKKKTHTPTRTANENRF